MGYMLSAYAVAYVIGQIPGGMLLDRFGSRTTYIWALALWSVFTITQGFVGALTGLSAAIMLYAMRFAVGLASAPCFPANARIVSNWFPTAERGTATAIFNSAQYFALVAFAPLMGWLVHGFGWPSVFYVMGGVGIVAVILFARFVHSPLDHPDIGKLEFDYIEKGGALIRLDEKAIRRPTQLTWRNVGQLLGNSTLVGIYLGQYCINVLTYFFLTWFPVYLVQQRGMSRDLLPGRFFHRPAGALRICRRHIGRPGLGFHPEANPLPDPGEKIAAVVRDAAGDADRHLQLCRCAMACCRHHGRRIFRQGCGGPGLGGGVRYLTQRIAGPEFQHL